MAKILSIRYTIVDGQLPNGMKLNPDTGAITGSPGSDAVGLGPTWNSPSSGSIGVMNEGDVFNTVSLSTTSNKGPVRFSLPTSNDKLPWGLKLDPITGTISGTAALLKQRTKEEGVTSDGPTWNTAFGKLGNYDEGFVASVSISATPIGNRTIARYNVIDGALPWGLKLNATTGVISGTTARLKNPGAFVDVPKLPLPVWNGPASLGTLYETQTASFQISATPDTGRSMAKYVIREGGLPFGLKLNPITGAITGTTAFIHLRKEAEYYDATNDPTWNTAAGTLGSFTKGSAVNVSVSASPATNRTIKSYHITNGRLPFGLIMNAATGAITGTIRNNALTVSGTYSFTVTVFDKDGSYFLANKSSRTFTLTVQ